MKLWIKNPQSGKPDTMLTLAVYSAAVVLIKFMLSGVTIGPVSSGNLDGTVIAAILTPTLGAYCARKYSDSVTIKKEEGSNEPK